jgi:hypothetical protein
MKKKVKLTKILTYQSIGFLAIIAVTWLNELLGLPALIFHGRFSISHFRQSTLEMLLILAVWLLVGSSTRRMLKRIRQLEDFMRVCAWCRRIDYKGEWMPLEDFLQEGFDTPTTHGICHECLEKQQAALLRAKQARKSAVADVAKAES